MERAGIARPCGYFNFGSKNGSSDVGRGIVQGHALQSLTDRIAMCMVRDQHRTRIRLRALGPAPDESALAPLETDIGKSAAERAKRQRTRPILPFPEEWPLEQR